MSFNISKSITIQIILGLCYQILLAVHEGKEGAMAAFWKEQSKQSGLHCANTGSQAAGAWGQRVGEKDRLVPPQRCSTCQCQVGHGALRHVADKTCWALSGAGELALPTSTTEPVMAQFKLRYCKHRTPSST